MTASVEVPNPDEEEEEEEDVFDGNSFFGQLNWSDILFPHLMPYLTIEDCFRLIQLNFNLFTIDWKICFVMQCSGIARNSAWRAQLDNFG